MLAGWASAAALVGNLLWGSAAAPAPDPSSVDRVEQLPGFDALLINQLNATIGTENLPAALGYPLEPGMFATLGLDGFQIYDDEPIALQAGRLGDRTLAPNCRSGCSKAFFDAFQLRWLAAAVESVGVTVEIPTRVLFAAHAQLPALTLIDAAYAAGETRPVQPPEFALLLNSAQRGIRSQRFFLVPPDGLVLGQVAALGLRVAFDEQGFVVSGNDPGLAGARRVPDSQGLLAMLRWVRKRHPGKVALVLEPSETTTVADLVAVMTAARTEDFTEFVLQGRPEMTF